MFVKKKLAMNNPKDKDETMGGKQGSDPAKHFNFLLLFSI
jgi:hypothetical protein